MVSTKSIVGLYEGEKMTKTCFLQGRKDSPPTKTENEERTKINKQANSQLSTDLFWERFDV
jgi:hypothetical protein